MFTSITDEDIKNADDSTNTGEMMGMFGGGTNEPGAMGTEDEDRTGLSGIIEKNNGLNGRNNPGSNGLFGNYKFT
jgi:hypothetical protein